MFANSTVLFSRFRSSVIEESNYTAGSGTYRLEDHYANGLMDLSAKTDVEYFPHRDHQIRFGAMMTRHLFTPSVQRHQEQDTELGIDTSLLQNYLQGLASSA